jgi:hypothetical protein
MRRKAGTLPKTKANAIIDELRAGKMSKAADLVEQTVYETLTYYAFPDIHWQKIRTNNPLERIMREIRRRTRVVGAFPDGQSCLNLAAARLRYLRKPALHLSDIVRKKNAPHCRVGISASAAICSIGLSGQAPKPLSGAPKARGLTAKARIERS